MCKVILISGLVLVGFNSAQAVDWGSDSLLNDSHRPERSWMSGFSNTAGVVAGDTLAAAIASCDAVVGADQYCVVEVAQVPTDLPLVITRSKTKLQGMPGVILTASGNGSFLEIQSDTHEVVIEGLELQGHQANSFIAGIQVDGENISHIAILNNKIHDFKVGDDNAHGIVVYGEGETEVLAITDIIIEGNEVYDMKTGSSESIVINGNVTNWEIKANHVHDVNNIAIDAIGGEGIAGTQTIGGKKFPSEVDAARYGFIENNTVETMSTLDNPAYGNQHSWAAAIYVDGGHHIRITGNQVTNAAWGYEIGAENCLTSSHILLENNTATDSHFGDLVIGGYAGRGYKNANPPINCDPNNTDDANEGHGYVENITVQNNTFAAGGTETPTIAPQFRLTHTIIAQPSAVAINDQGDGSATGDENAIKTTASSLSLTGDANDDAVVDIKDVIFIINIILGSEATTEAANCNTDVDGIIDIQDVICTINAVLG